MKLQFEREICIVRAERNGLVGYADGATDPTIAWGSDREFAAWAGNCLLSGKVDEPTTEDVQAVARRLVAADTVVDLPTRQRKGWLG